MPLITGPEWDNFLKQFPEVHVLQMRQWGELKAKFGWYPKWVQNTGCGAQILFRKLPLGFTIAYIPKGPVGLPTQTFWQEVSKLCWSNRAVFLKVEPDSWDSEPLNFNAEGWRLSECIQPRRTIVIDLHGRPEDWLERMKQKTRYNIRLAEKKDVKVKPWQDFDGFYEMMRITGGRDGFGVHSASYYRDVYNLFKTKGACELLMAEYDGTPLAALMVLYRGTRAWYFYGASTDLERNRMPTYGLQWETMKWAAERGCTSYDLWGVPDEEEEKLENDFTERSDGLWGVYRFKRGFGGCLMRSSAAYEKVYNLPMYWLYQWYRKRTKETG
jgi:lipid II:glycine glycyltransferase (peptidoglycan interpeptide bridge formation enzyme)